jgi:hypothetical protein
VGGLIYTPHPRSRVCPFGSRVCPFGSRVHPPPLQHAPVRARAQCCTCLHPYKCPHRNGCARIAFRPCEDIVFAPSPTRPRPLTRICARCVCACSREHAKSLCPVPRIRAWSPRPTHVHPQSRTREESAPGSTRPRLESAPSPTRPRSLARVRAQRGRAFTSGRTRATSMCPQSFPAGAPCSRVRP